MSKTLEQKTNAAGFPKAREIIELSGAGSGQLTLHDRRVLNLLYQHAHDTHGLDYTGDFEIPISAIRGVHKGGERVRDSLTRLMSVVVKFQQNRKGKIWIVQTHLFDGTESTEDETDDGIIRYSIPAKLRPILKNSRSWGRIRAEVIMAMSSKYSVALYELIQARVNLDQWQETFDLQHFRELIGVPEGKLLQPKNLMTKSLKPSELEVNGLSDYGVKLEPVRQGGKIRGKLVGVRVSWWRKSPDEYRASQDEIKRSKIGRMARLKGEVEDLAIAQHQQREAISRSLEEAGKLALNNIKNTKIR